MNPESAALVTRHGKGPAIARTLQPLGIAVVVLDSVDTDAFGTFAGEKPRAGSALDAARAKARAARGSGPWGWALASEGTYGPHPAAPFLIWGEELVLAVDLRSGLEVVGRQRGPAPWAWQARLRNRIEAEAFVPPTVVPFVVTSCVEGRARPDLGLRKAVRLKALGSIWEAVDRGEGVWLQAELRAHLNPERMAGVAAAAEDLARRLAARCPACGAPGFGEIPPIPGRPCRDCGSPTELPFALRSGCPACGHTQVRPLVLKADPRDCAGCNP